MSGMVVTFDTPEDITNPGFDGKVVRFPAKLIDQNDIGTPRQSSTTKSVRISVEVSGSRIETWGLEQPDLMKVMFELAKEALFTALNSGTWTEGDLKVMVNTRTHKGPCPFNPALIQEPAGAVVNIEVKRPLIGFKPSSTNSM
jgi:hypothetical protein